MASVIFWRDSCASRERESPIRHDMHLTDAHTRTFFSLSVSHFTHARCVWLKMFQGEKSPRHHFVFTSISFLDVVAEHSLLFFPSSPILTNRLTIQTFSVYSIHGRKLQGKPLRARSQEWDVWPNG